MTPLTPEERAAVDAVPEDAERLRAAFGVAASERPGESIQLSLQRPALNVRGLASAFVGPDARTLIPDRAVAAVDVRLIRETPPESDPLAAGLVNALTSAWGEPPIRIRTGGGTVPIAPFIDALGFPAVIGPIVNFDNNQHAAGENLQLGAFYRGNLDCGGPEIGALGRRPHGIEVVEPIRTRRGLDLDSLGR